MAGCPVVTVPVGGVRDLVDDGETGIVTEDLDPRRARGDGSSGSLRDPQLRSAAGRARPAPGGAVLLERAPRAPTRRRLSELLGPDRSHGGRDLDREV